VRVSCLCPQGVNTPMLNAGLTSDDDGKKAADIVKAAGNVLEPEQVADAVVEAIREERLLILPHPEVGTYMSHRGDDHERWLRGMRRLQGYLQV